MTNAFKRLTFKLAVLQKCAIQNSLNSSDQTEDKHIIIT